LRAHPVGLDISDTRSVSTGIGAAVDAYGHVDVLVNNAGIAIDGLLHRASHPNFDRICETLETNLYGAWACAAAVIPHMREAGYGRIVNVTSNMASLGLIETAESPAYRVSKAALNMLTVVLAAELRGTGILVNAASPGYTRTDMSPKCHPLCRRGSRHAGLAGYPPLRRADWRLLLFALPAGVVRPKGLSYACC
jgi:NAD(P)-dependent dehydrogenase (short-subunit alcohol dehydrogenase family)